MEGSSSSSTNVPKTYDIFLSFRGEDTRNNFTAHLHSALCRVGFYTFVDDRKLERGKPISPELLKAIENSRCSVVVLSRNYASSTWCLDELLKILDCFEFMGQIVLPIFYHVDPSDIRKQTGAFGKAFVLHEKNFRDNPSKVQIWRDALKQVANLSGWALQEDRDESKFIQETVAHILNKVTIASLDISKDLVGMDIRMEKLNSHVQIGFNDVRMIGICGMGGLGKTTIARAYYSIWYCRFEGCCFLDNVKEAFEKYGPISLQEKLISETSNEKCISIKDADRVIRSRLRLRRVLIILDGVDQLNQLKKLAGSLDWFGPGSRIMITTRDKSLLRKHGVTSVYKPEQLNHVEALRLFSWNAFKETHPLESYRTLSDKVLTYAKGLPLALEVLGSFLFGKSANEWQSALDRLKEYPKKEIIDVLRISFKGLEETEKNIFLDIACFFKGQDIGFVTRVMDCCGFYPEIGLRTLIDKSLLIIRDGGIWMHDLLQEMGTEIVRKRSRKEPGGRSRLWLYEDFCRVLRKNSGMIEVEAICVSSSGRKARSHLGFHAFSKMKLRLLCITGNYRWDLSSHSCGDLFSESLRFIKWEGYPFRYLLSSFQLTGLVELHMEFSIIEQLFNGEVEPLYNLKIIDLSHSQSLIKIQDLQVVPNLEQLSLGFCTGLKEIDSSIVAPEKLTLLDLKGCSSLENLPSNMNQLKSLKVLNLRSCSCLPRTVEYSVCLEELDMSGAWQKSIGKGLLSSRLYSLRKLELSHCYLFDEAFPDDYFGSMVSLEHLDLSANCFKKLPQGLSQLPKLEHLHLDDCQSLNLLGELPPSLVLLTTINCTWLYDPILVTQSNLRCSAICVDCPNLVLECEGSDRMILTLLKRYVQNPPSSSERFDIVVPGRRLPGWFIHQSYSSSITVDLYPNWCNNKWMGFVLCLVYDAEIGIRGFQGDVKINLQDWGLGIINLPYDFSINSYDISPRISQRTLQYMRPIFKRENEHLWLMYLPCSNFFLPQWQDNKSCQIEFSFQPYSIINCGVRLLYDEDIEELEPYLVGMEPGTTSWEADNICIL